MDHFNLDKIIDYLIYNKGGDLDYIGLYKGKMGFAYYNFFLSKYLNEQRFMDYSQKIVEEVFEEINRPNALIYTNPSLVNGLAGIGCCLNVLISNGFIDSDNLEEQFEVLDKYLEKFFYALLNKDNTDFLGGTAGLLYYFSLRFERNKSKIKIILDRLFDCFKKKLIYNQFGISIITRQGYLKKQGYDLSLAHGTIGTYFILLNLFELGYEQEEIRNIVTEGIDFIVNVSQAYKNNSGNNSLFPNFLGVENSSLKININEVYHSHRLAWCNGDLSILLLLNRAGHLLSENKFTSLAENIKMQTIERTLYSETRIEFSYFCHGACGVSRAYKNLYELTGDMTYQKAYQHWVNESKMKLDEEFSKIKKIPYVSSMLFGWPSVILTLLDNSSNLKLNWDKIFLLSN